MKNISEGIGSFLGEPVSAYKPMILRIGSVGELTAVEGMEDVSIVDRLDEQLKELIKSRNPGTRFDQALFNTHIERYLNGRDPAAIGVWVFYPWLRKIVHLLPEDEFVEVRTNRNRHKLTVEEQTLLRTKKIGIIGLSVGQSIALTLAMERTCGELRLADFDEVELSNLNRIRTGVHNLGLKKVVIAAREIAEIDPFIRVSIFPEGVTDQNTEDFFTGSGKLDLLVEVCDGLNVKITSRFKARELGIPVVMDTNDRGMLDIERFDLEPSRPVLHGLAAGLDPETIGDLTNEQKIPYILEMVSARNISSRLKASMIEVEQSISTWPQLASSVVLGGAITTDICRRILLDQFRESGRYYVDLDEIVAPGKQIEFNTSAPTAQTTGNWESLLGHALTGRLQLRMLPFTLEAKSEDSAIVLLRHQSHSCLFTAGALIEAMNAVLNQTNQYLELQGAGERLALQIKEGPAPAPDKAACIHTKTVTADQPAAVAYTQLERLLHFSPEAHRELYDDITFDAQPGKIDFANTGMPAFARPLYLMAADSAAATYLAQWNLGAALQKLAAYRLAAASGCELALIPAGTDPLQAGRNFFGSLDHTTTAEINTIVDLAKNCTDISDVYKNELKTCLGRIQQDADLYPEIAALICLKKAN